MIYVILFLPNVYDMCNTGQIRFGKNLMGIIDETFVRMIALRPKKGICDKSHMVSIALLFVGLHCCG